MEVDLYRSLPSGLTVHTARMFMEDTTAAGESRMLDEFAIPAARDLATARPDVVVFGCTSAGALRGNAYDAELCQRISEATGAPTISTIAAVRENLASAGGSRVGVVTPYTDELNRPIRASLEADGLQVVSIHGLGITVNFQIAEVAPKAIARLAVEELGCLQLDCLFVSCTNFRGVEALPMLRTYFDLPCVTSNQAVINALGAFFELDEETG
jgi:maleate isomerase